MILDRLISVGCNVAEVDVSGWNCLFHCVLNASTPDFSQELQALIHLLGHFHDIGAKDYAGMTIFDYVRDTSGIYGSYRRDLFTTALARVESGGDEPSIQYAVYTPIYLPEHHLAMRYLHSWTRRDVTIKLRSLAVSCPSLNHDILQIMARIHQFCEETSRPKGVQITARTIQVGNIRSPMRPHVAVVKGVLRSVLRRGEKPERDQYRFFRMVKIAR